MTHLQKAPRKPLLNVNQGKVFISHLDNDLHKGIAKNIFVDGMTNAEIAEDYFYCERQVERIRMGLLKTVLKKLIEKQIPKKATEETINRGIDISGEYDIDFNLCCPVCGGVVGTFEGGEDEYFSKYCPNCGQALDWSDSE